MKIYDSAIFFSTINKALKTETVHMLQYIFRKINMRTNDFSFLLIKSQTVLLICSLLWK